MALRRSLIIVLAAAQISAASCAPTGKGIAADTGELVIVTGAGERRFEVEIADTDEERAIGLMHRTSMPEDSGMLFDYSDNVDDHSMWMKNTLIPLDMAFIAKDGRIIRIAANTTPRSLASIGSGAPVAAILEVNGGRLEALGVAEGDLVRHPIFEDQ